MPGADQSPATETDASSGPTNPPPDTVLDAPPVTDVPVARTFGAYEEIEAPEPPPVPPHAGGADSADEPAPVAPPEEGQPASVVPALPLAAPPPASPQPPVPPPSIEPPVGGGAPTEGPVAAARARHVQEAVAPAPGGGDWASSFVSLFPQDRPELAAGAAFAGGVVVALILKRLGR